MVRSINIGFLPGTIPPVKCLRKHPDSAPWEEPYGGFIPGLSFIVVNIIRVRLFFKETEREWISLIDS
jgi:hypothetical protein